MKKIFQILAVVVAVLMATPFVLYAVVVALRFTLFYLSLARTDAGACTHYFVGESKGTLWQNGEWHHYVDFKVDVSAPREQWKLVNAPLPSTLWRFPSPAPDIIRASYRWPSNWQDPFPLSSWKICLLGS